MLKVGEKAPAFEVMDQTGATRTLDDFAGKRVVLWFYPKADTPGCTAEGCGFRDRARQFDELGVVILGASFDGPTANDAFKEKYDFPFDLLCDTEKTLARAYGACGDDSAKHPDRISVVIAPDGTVERVYPNVNARTHFDDVLKDLGGTPPPPEKKGFLRRLFGG